MRLFDVRDPARCGDILRAAVDGARVIALVDGLFDHTPSTWHKEILWALSSGAVVAGAASMGALRACECEPFGMIGIGRIFEDYRSGLRTADSDVALLHAPGQLGYRPLTVPLVDAEATVEFLRSAALITGFEAETILRQASLLHFRRRDWSSMLAALPTSATRRAELIDLVDRHRISQKSADARMLLEAIASGSLPKPPLRRPWRLSTTPFLLSLAELPAG